jgi:hypothetical protein
MVELLDVILRLFVAIEDAFSNLKGRFKLIIEMT